MMNDNIDPQLAQNGDPRNVQDTYKNWKLEAIKNDLQAKAFGVHVAIENYQHDYNIGTIVRSANAFNVAGVHIIGKRHWNRRGAMATEKYLQLYHHPTVVDFINWVAPTTLVIIGIDNIANSIPLHQANISENAILVFGQEGPGLSVEMQSYCKRIIAIEQFGSTRSINVGVAAGIVLYEWVRRHHITM